MFLLQCLTDIRRKIFPSLNDHYTIEKYIDSNINIDSNISNIIIHRPITNKPFGIPDKIWWEYEAAKSKKVKEKLCDDDSEDDRNDYTDEYINDDKEKIEKINTFLETSNKLLKKSEEFSNIKDVNKWRDTINTKREYLQQALKKTAKLS
jgi:hypothetical protein